MLQRREGFKHFTSSVPLLVFGIITFKYLDGDLGFLGCGVYLLKLVDNAAPRVLLSTLGY